MIRFAQCKIGPDKKTGAVYLFTCIITLTLICLHVYTYMCVCDYVYMYTRIQSCMRAGQGGWLLPPLTKPETTPLVRMSTVTII